ncbi:hypothetical protein R5W24_004209 [Gemmata sp. JC717]|uniref:hypothetical protein n=1 Tax=Gemmata algarum TaxID=2975278 RepID=UPI0021BB7AD5|nr:hypothetical protein [Gemmata algarum]MDY3555074.1 hypothetical protein [Gemmata algarum]
MRPVILWLACCALVAAAGCGSEPRPVAPRNASVNDKLVAVSKGFSEATAGLGHPPKTDAELRPYLERFGPPDEVLRSPNDDQPMVVNFRAVAPGDVVACERAGAGGRRAAVNVRGEVSTISEADFARLQSPGTGPKPKMDPPAEGHKQGSLKGIIDKAGGPKQP